MVAGLWIQASDAILGFLIFEPDRLVAVSVFKGLAFVIVTSILLYFLVQRSFQKIQSSYRALEFSQALTTGQKQILEQVATGVALERVLQQLVLLIEQLAPGTLCSILLLDSGAGTLRHAAAPNLPEAFCLAVDNSPIGPAAGSCGTAAYLGSAVFVADIATDPRWYGYRELVLPFGLKSCWSTPILSGLKSEVLGTFAMYSKVVGLPTEDQKQLLEVSSHLAVVAIEQERAQAALRLIREGLEHTVTQRTYELSVALERAEVADRLKSAFLATMSHELRTPLNSIIGFTGVLIQGLAGPLNNEQLKQMKMVQGSSRHLLALINDVLDLSRIEAGQLKLKVVSFSVEESIRKVYLGLLPMAESKGLSLNYSVECEGLDLETDRRRFEQIVINLVQNAIKFTEVGEVKIFARTATEAGRTQLCIEVRDTGSGILEEDLDTIFEAFSQLDTGLTRLHEGTGLGLAICRRLAVLLGGRIEVASQWRHGTSFTLVLPLCVKEVSDLAQDCVAH